LTFINTLAAAAAAVVTASVTVIATNALIPA
jgi:hypothetical protein